MAQEAGSVSLEDFLGGSVVSATKTTQTVREAPAIIEVISAKDIQERQYRSVAEALRTVPGFSVLFDYTNYNVGVRGINSGQRGWSRIIKVMINNQPTALRTDATNFLGPELVPMTAIKRIEIIRGPGSALYGADAFLGVINIVTKSGDDLAGGEAVLEMGTFSRGNASGSLSFGQFGDLFGRNVDYTVSAAGGYGDRSGLTVADTSPRQATFAGQTTQGDVTQPLSAFASFNWGDAQGGLLSVTGSFQQAKSAGKFQDWSIEQRILDSQNQLAINNGFLRASLDQQLGDNLFVNLAGAYVQGGPTDADRLDVGNPNYWQLRRSGYHGFDLSGSLLYQWSLRDSLTLGADYSQNQQRIQSIYHLFRQPLGVNQPGDVVLEGQDLGTKTFSNVGIFGQGIVYPLDQLGITGGVRFDHHNVYGGTLNYRAGLINLWSDAVSTKLLYGTSYRAPSPLQLFSSPISLGDIIGNPDLKPETAQTVESEVAWAITPGLVLSLTGYHTQVHDQVKFVRETSNTVARNIAKATTLGLEGALRFQLEGVKGYVNGTLQQTDTGGAANEVYTSQDLRSEMFPSGTVTTGLSAPLPGVPLDLYVEGRYTSSMKPSEANFFRNSGVDYEIPPSLLLDMALTTRELRLFDQPASVALKVANLLNTTHTYPGFAGIDIPGEGLSLQIHMRQWF